MKAAQFFAAKDIRVVQVPIPEPKEHEALIAIEWSGICGSDLHEYLHGRLQKHTLIRVLADNPRSYNHASRGTTPSRYQRKHTSYYGP
jgi:hypothetical protein